MGGGCSPVGDDLSDGLIELPPALHEISGIAPVDERTIACVQDEIGAVFLIDLLGEREARVVPFGPNGDYEGIAYTGSEYWVLRSDGALLRLQQREDGLEIAATHRLPKDCEYEGLCFDSRNRRLLALPKGAISDKKKERRRRRIYAFDLASQSVVDKAIVTVRVDHLIEQAEEQGMAVPTRTTKKGNIKPDLKLRGSEITVAPDGESLLLLSATDHLLIRVDRAGRLLATQRLDALRWPQPEAMAFLPDGRLIVASEGVRGPAVLAVASGLD